MLGRVAQAGAVASLVWVGADVVSPPEDRSSRRDSTQTVRSTTMNELPDPMEMPWRHLLDPTDSEPTSSGDETDEGLENVAENSDPEDIVIDRELPHGFDVPQNLSDSEEEQEYDYDEDDEDDEEEERVVEIGRRRSDRHRRSAIVSRGDDDPDRNTRRFAFR